MEIEYIIFVIVVILLSMTLHEVMHGFMAYVLGDDTAKAQGRLTLNPVRHIDPFLTLILPVILAITQMPIFGGAKPVPFNPERVRYGEWGVALVSIAGPLTNLLIAFVSFGLYVLFLGNNSLIESFLKVAIYVNLGFFAFNMLPIPPLDGSRVVYALAPDFVRQGMEYIERFGLIFIFAIVLIGGPFIGAFIGGSVDGLIGVFEIIFGIGRA